jgi:hypothetical protein
MSAAAFRKVGGFKGHIRQITQTAKKRVVVRKSFVYNYTNTRVAK